MLIPATNKDSFLTSAAAFALISFLDDQHSDWGELEYQSSFSLYLLDIEYLKRYLLVISVSSFESCLFSS